MITLGSRIERASGRGAITFVTGSAEQRVPWSQLHEDARAMAWARQRSSIAVRPAATVRALSESGR